MAFPTIDPADLTVPVARIGITGLGYECIFAGCQAFICPWFAIMVLCYSYHLPGYYDPQGFTTLLLSKSDGRGNYGIPIGADLPDTPGFLSHSLRNCFGGDIDNRLHSL